eukprot:7533625-Karenia_brevis.AAC.1
MSRPGNAVLQPPSILLSPHHTARTCCRKHRGRAASQQKFMSSTSGTTSTPPPIAPSKASRSSQLWVSLPVVGGRRPFAPSKLSPVPWL